jgi:hypothetical protein
MSEAVVAAIDLRAIWTDGETTRVGMTIWQPIREPEGGWSCKLELPGLHEDLEPIHGEDSLQALCLALGLARTLLNSVVATGVRLEYPNGEEFPLEHYFSPL